ncbi:clamp loader of DNA polymerase [Dinoroseobacter phage vB_DshS-R5C]|uniref:Putative DNA polymerase III, subunit gamma and tau n=1 Tax=Dinoroseobacter phage vB_DshS-R5C TaxID=1965368 RepID=A0A1V0DYC6_9CAUD|nr:clamp loader of DNA polymerase [Dinoroseobacter phage vB_DshS-R5C]ARB06153.1 putative DNA polymerase III, subunit gamma and tau [Dinoroseobacter phage vB_DshS-R5C]
MSETLHTKYRPTTLEEVVGQDHIKKGLAATLAEGKQQAFLFEGPSGTGKTTLARICAKDLGLAEVIEIDAATHTGVDAMREVASRANYVSMDGSGKAFIVDECHRLSKQAWESLLKDIEEPPAGVFWFFCTTEPNKILPTIRSRCVTYTLKDVPYRALMRLLDDVSKREGLELPEDVLDAAADNAHGSPRQALVNLTTVKHAENASDALAALNRLAGSKAAFDLAKMIIKPQYQFADAMALLKEIKSEPPESIRHTVRAYATTAILNSPDNRWARGVLMAFIEPAVDHNQISDIVARLITMEKWKK